MPTNEQPYTLQRILGKRVKGNGHHPNEAIIGKNKRRARNKAARKSRTFNRKRR